MCFDFATGYLHVLSKSKKVESARFASLSRFIFNLASSISTKKRDVQQTLLRHHVERSMIELVRFTLIIYVTGMKAF